VKATAWITFGWVGAGIDRDSLFPQLRLGCIAIGWCRGSIHDKCEAMRVQLTHALEVLGWGQKP
jgi:hypothetical protein